MPLSAGADQNQTTSRILNKLQYAMTDVAADITTATTSDIIPMLDASDGYEVKYADSANVFEVMGITATAAEINAGADGSANTTIVAAGGGAVTVPTGGGKIIIPLLTSNATVALPAPTVGMTYTFVWSGTAADAEDTIITTAASTFFVGGLTSLISGTVDVTPVYANGTTHNTLSVLNPDGGSWVTIIGMSATQWAVAGNAVSVATAPTFTAV